MYSALQKQKSIINEEHRADRHGEDVHRCHSLLKSERAQRASAQ